MVSKKRLLIGGGVLAFLLGAGATYLISSTWGEVQRVSIERPPPAESEEVKGDGARVQPAPSEELGRAEAWDVFLLVGSDSREELEDTSAFGTHEGRRADVVMVLLRGESSIGVLSLPRDLWVDDPCSGRQNRINMMLEGCAETINGPTLLTLTVESLIGEDVDHFAMVDLAGFQEAVNAIGGYEICVERPVRDEKANLELAAGCTMASGEQTLAWLRSRRTQELIDSGWRTMPGVNDLKRNERQRAFLIDMMGQLSDFSSPQDMAAVANAVAPFVTVDTELTFMSAVNLAWTLRGLNDGAIVELELPVYDHTTEAGAAVLLAAEPVDEIVAGFLGSETAGESPSGKTG